MLCALIMAGGKGTRFWPLSTEDEPKQFLNLVGNKSMIEMTVNRVKDIIPIERIFVATDSKYINLVIEHLPEIPFENIIIEPLGMNTAPCIALSSMIIKKQFKNATLAILPADHLIKDDNLFRNSLIAADKFIEENQQSIITFGMEVTRPEVGFGYIKYENDSKNVSGFTFNKVDKFVEKPNLDLAKTYMNAGCYLWNAGIFMWKVKRIIELTEMHLPRTYDILNQIIKSSKADFEKKLYELYPQVENISVDYGIMEKAEEIYVVPSSFGWDDIGSWEAIERYNAKDEQGNISIGKIVNLKCNNNIIISDDTEVIVDSLSDIYVIKSKGKIIVGRKDKMNNIKDFKHITNNGR